jgi:hypothetical protein
MAAPSVTDLFCKAVSKGSLDELNVLYRKHGPEGIVANLMETPCNKQGDSCLKVAVDSEFYDVLEFLVHQLKKHIMCSKWKSSIENVSLFSWETYTFQEVTEPFVLSPDIAIIRDICHQMPITKLIEYLVDVNIDQPLWLEFVLNSIMASSIPRQNKIIALECMGIAFIFKQTCYNIGRKTQFNEFIFWRGLRCWKEALILRNVTADGDPAIPKVPFELSEILRNALGDITEFETVKELEQLEQQWSLRREFEEWRILRQSLEAQALLVGHRIFTQQKSLLSTGMNSFHLENFVLFFKHIRDSEWMLKQYSVRKFNICLIILDLSYGFRFNLTSPLKYIEHFDAAIYVLFEYAKFAHIPRDSPNIVLTVKYTLAALTNVFSISRYFHRNSSNAQTKIRVLLSEWLSYLTQEQIANVKECLIPFFRISNPLYHYNYTGLLCQSVVGHCRGRGVQLIQLLLDAGADPQTISRKGKTPFHWLFEGWSAYEPYEFKVVFKALMEAGGHVDQVNKDGDSALSLIIDWRTSTLPFGDLVRDPYFDSIIYSVLPLSCSCAQVIGENQIPFENLPSRLKSFVLRHSAIKVT